jgi:OOP family OmpA-OmpF porin
MKNIKSLAMALSLMGFAAATSAHDVGNWSSSAGEVWKNTPGECWRTGFWTPANALPGCDGAITEKAAAPAVKPDPVMPTPEVAPAPATTPVAAPAAAPAPAPAPAAAPAAAAAVSSKVTYAADAFFDFDKSVIKPEGKAKLDDLVGKVKAINLEVIIAVGHTDSLGSDTYNQKLSLRRSQAVKAYLVSKGIDKTRIYTEGKGEKQPVADNKTKEGRAKNRRVEIEVVGSRKN